MGRNLGNVLWGLIFIAVGVVLAGNVFNFWHVSLFFDGWWTLFIIIPCVFSMFQGGVNVSNVLGTAVGVLLLLSAQDIISWDFVWKMILPLMLICIGLSIIFGSNFINNSEEVKKLSKDGLTKYTAVFGSQELSFPNEEFKGASIVAVFGGVDLNLKDARIYHDVVINVTSVFGGGEILVPPNVKVKVSSLPIFGGVSNKATRIDDSKESPTIYINSVCVFGGMDIK